jgi:hypothetical protein
VVLLLECDSVSRNVLQCRPLKSRRPDVGIQSASVQVLNYSGGWTEVDVLENLTFQGMRAQLNVIVGPVGSGKVEAALEDIQYAIYTILE